MLIGQIVSEFNKREILCRGGDEFHSRMNGSILCMKNNKNISED
jgi:hypothetical protein